MEKFEGKAAQFLAVLEALHDSSVRPLQTGMPKEFEVQEVAMELISAGSSLLSGMYGYHPFSPFICLLVNPNRTNTIAVNGDWSFQALKTMPNLHKSFSLFINWPMCYSKPIKCYTKDTFYTMCLWLLLPSVQSQWMGTGAFTLWKWCQPCIKVSYAQYNSNVIFWRLRWTKQNTWWSIPLNI